MGRATTRLLACAGLWLGACAAPEPIAAPGESIALCCKALGPGQNSFVGCRPQARVCRSSESLWVRGPLVCVEAGEQGCREGMCCELGAVGVEPAGGSEPAAGPEPAPRMLAQIVEQLPKPIRVPKLVCTAVVERELEGATLLEVEVDADGEVRGVEIVEGFEPSCDALAREALLNAEFEPATDLDGQPVASALRYEYLFALAD